MLSFPGFKGCITIKWCTFWTYQTVLAVLLFAFTHLDIISTTLMIIYLKSKCEDISLEHQLSTLEYRRNIDIEVFGEEYRDIWFSPYRPALAWSWQKRKLFLLRQCAMYGWILGFLTGFWFLPNLRISSQRTEPYACTRRASHRSDGAVDYGKVFT